MFKEDAGRGERFSAEAAGLYLDYSKHRITGETVRLLVALAEDCGLRGRIDAMFRGDQINVTEKRSVLHTALRAGGKSLAAAAVGALVLGALPLTWAYTASWPALVGTGYGSLVLTKAALLTAVLAVAFVTRRAVRSGVGLPPGSALRERVPRLAEAETIVLVIVLFAAASISAQPPAVVA